MRNAVMSDDRLEAVSRFIEKHGLLASILTLIFGVMAYLAAFHPLTFLDLFRDLIAAPWLIVGAVALTACYIAIQSLSNRIDAMEQAIEDLRQERDLEKKLRFAVQREWLHWATTETNLLTVAEAWAALDSILDRERELFKRRDYQKRNKMTGEHER